MWQTCENNLANFIDGYENFDSMQKKKHSAVRGAGGVAFFVKDWVIQSGVECIIQNFNECVVLLFKATSLRGSEDLIIMVTYITPENSPVYTDEDNGLIILNKKISEILVHFPNAELFIAGV